MPPRHAASAKVLHVTYIYIYSYSYRCFTPSCFLPSSMCGNVCCTAGTQPLWHCTHPLIYAWRIQSCHGAHTLSLKPTSPHPATPLPAPPTTARSPTSVWHWSGLALDEGPAAAEWLATYLGRPARLVRHVGEVAELQARAAAAGSSAQRITSDDFVEGYPVNFQDAYACLLASEVGLCAGLHSMPSDVALEVPWDVASCACLLADAARG